MKIIGAILNLLSYTLTFWTGGYFTLAVALTDCTGGLILDEVMQVLSSPVSCFHWLLK